MGVRHALRLPVSSSRPVHPRRRASEVMVRRRRFLVWDRPKRRPRARRSHPAVTGAAPAFADLAQRQRRSAPNSRSALFAHLRFHFPDPLGAADAHLHFVLLEAGDDAPAARFDARAEPGDVGLAQSHRIGLSEGPPCRREHRGGEKSGEASCRTGMAFPIAAPRDERGRPRKARAFGASRSSAGLGATYRAVSSWLTSRKNSPWLTASAAACPAAPRPDNNGGGGGPKPAGRPPSVSTPERSDVAGIWPRIRAQPSGASPHCAARVKPSVAAEGRRRPPGRSAKARQEPPAARLRPSPTVQILFRVASSP